MIGANYNSEIQEIIAQELDALLYEATNELTVLSGQVVLEGEYDQGVVFANIVNGQVQFKDFTYGPGTLILLFRTLGEPRELLVIPESRVSGAIQAAGLVIDDISQMVIGIDHNTLLPLARVGEDVIARVIASGNDDPSWIAEEVLAVAPEASSVGLNLDTGTFEAWSGEKVGDGELLAVQHNKSGNWIEFLDYEDLPSLLTWLQVKVRRFIWTAIPFNWIALDEEGYFVAGYSIESGRWHEGVDNLILKQGEVFRWNFSDGKFDDEAVFSFDPKQYDPSEGDQFVDRMKLTRVGEKEYAISLFGQTQIEFRLVHGQDLAQTSTWDTVVIVDHKYGDGEILEAGVRYVSRLQSVEIIGRVIELTRAAGFIPGDEDEWYLVANIGDRLVYFWLGADENKLGICSLPRIGDELRIVPGIGSCKFYFVKNVIGWLEQNPEMPFIHNFSLSVINDEVMEEQLNKPSCNEYCRRIWDVLEYLETQELLNDIVVSLGGNKGYYTGDLPTVIVGYSFTMPQNVLVDP